MEDTTRVSVETPDESDWEASDDDTDTFLDHWLRRVEAVGRLQDRERRRVGLQTGQQLVDCLLLDEVHRRDFYEFTRMWPHTFDKLINWLRRRGKLVDSKLLSVEEKLLIFLHIVTKNASWRETALTFNHSPATLTAVFDEALEALLPLYGDIVVLPSNRCPSKIRDDEEKYYPYFRGVVGTVDGSHVPIWVRNEVNTYEVWPNRKQWKSQNVMAAVDFDLNFVFVYPGWEVSSIHGNRHPPINFSPIANMDKPFCRLTPIYNRK